MEVIHAFTKLWIEALLTSEMIEHRSKETSDAEFELFTVYYTQYSSTSIGLNRYAKKCIQRYCVQGAVEYCQILNLLDVK
jgi:hypothetical protein